MVLPFAPINSLIAFTIIWILTSLLPQTTKPAPLLAFKAAAAALIPLLNSALPMAGEVTAPPNFANKANATAPVSDGLCKYLSSALLPVKLKPPSK